MSLPLHRLQARMKRDLYLPIAFRVALKAGDVPWSSAIADPAAAAAALRRFQRLIQADGVVAWFDGWLEAEAAGARVRRDAFGVVAGTPASPTRLPSVAGFTETPAIRHVLEITRLLCEATREQSTVLGCLTGVRILTARLLGARPAPGVDVEPAAIEISGALARAYCEAGVGALLIASELPFPDPSVARHFSPLAEIARSFGVPLMLLTRHPMGPSVEAALRAAGIDHVAAPGGHGSVCAISSTMLRAAPAASEGWFRLQRDAKPAPRLFVSEWEVPVDAPVETLVALREKVVA